MLTAGRVIKAFEEITGDELELMPFPDELDGIVPRVDYLSFARVVHEPDGAPRVVPASEMLREKYGDFVIAVYESGVPRLELGGARDERGVRWLTLLAEVGPRPGEYVAAEKIYGNNIRLTWYPESRRRETTRQWERLDAALSKLVGRWSRG